MIIAGIIYVCGVVGFFIYHVTEYPENAQIAFCEGLIWPLSVFVRIAEWCEK